MEAAETLAERTTNATFDAVDVGVGADGIKDRLTKKEIGDAIDIAHEEGYKVVEDLL